MNFSLFLALRYLKPKRTFVSVITLLCVAGVCIGVATLLVVIAVMAGFERKIKDTVLGFEPHIVLETDDLGSVDENGFPLGNDYREVLGRIRGIDGVVSASAFLQGPVFIPVGNEPLPTLMIAIDPDDEAQMETLTKLDTRGSFALEGNTAVVGASLIDEFARRGEIVDIGSTITVYSPKNVKELLRAVREVEEQDSETEAKTVLDEIQNMILPVDLEVVGIFDSPHYGQSFFVPLHVGQELYELTDAVPSISVRTVDPYRVQEFKQRILDATPASWWPVTWTEKHRNWFETIRMERTMMYFVLFMIIIVAAFSIMVTMITVTVQKRQEIGVVGAIGARMSQIVWIFLSQGMVVGAIGVAFGLGCGALILRFRNDIRALIAQTTGREIFDSSVYGIAEIPALVLPLDVVTICGGAFVACALAALIPAVAASVIDPAKALRNLT